MPQIGQSPGWGWRICGCMEQVQTVSVVVAVSGCDSCLDVSVDGASHHPAAKAATMAGTRKNGVRMDMGRSPFIERQLKKVR